MAMPYIRVLGLVFLICWCTHGFVARPFAFRRPSLYSRLEMMGMSAWRASVANQTAGDIARLLVLDTTVGYLALQGEKIVRTIQEDDEEQEMEFLDDVVLNNSAVCGMRLKNLDKQTIGTMALVEVERYNEGKDGMETLLHCKGRAKIVEILQEEPYVVARCQEVFDEPIANQAEYDKLNDMCDEIEFLVNRTTLMQGHINLLFTSNRTVLSRMQLNFDGIPYYDDDPEDMYFVEKPRGMKSYYRLFREVYWNAYRSYHCHNDDDGNDDAHDSAVVVVDGTIRENRRSVRELTAIGWAALCTYRDYRDQNFKRRVRALETVRLEERLRMGLRIQQLERQLFESQYREQLLELQEYRTENGVEVLDYDLLYDDDDYTYELGFM